MKFNPITFISFLFILACGSPPPNKKQIKETYDNLACYEALIKTISDDKNLLKELISIRDSKKRHNLDTVLMKRAGRRFNMDSIKAKRIFRLIEPEEIIDIINSVVPAMCQEVFNKKHQFRGIRIIDKNSMIVEVNKYRRYHDTYSTTDIDERHLLIFSNKKLNKSNFHLNGERIFKNEKIKENLIYQITQHSYSY